MNEMHKILIPIDGSKHAQKALAQGIALAELCQAEIGLLHVVDLDAQTSAFEQVSTGGYIPGEVKEHGYALAMEAMHQIPAHIKAQPIVKVGRPPEIILGICENDNYDCIVMGSRGLGTLSKIFLGSVSQYILSYAPCPVMIVR